MIRTSYRSNFGRFFEWLSCISTLKVIKFYSNKCAFIILVHNLTILHDFSLWTTCNICLSRNTRIWYFEKYNSDYDFFLHHWQWPKTFHTDRSNSIETAIAIAISSTEFLLDLLAFWSLVFCVTSFGQLLARGSHQSPIFPLREHKWSLTRLSKDLFTFDLVDDGKPWTTTLQSEKGQKQPILQFTILQLFLLKLLQI